MRGPTQFADYVYLHVGTDDGGFRPGRYRVVSPFCDRDEFLHSPGDEWLLMYAGFNRFEDEWVLFVSLDEKHQWTISLWSDPVGQQEVIDNFSRFAERLGPLPSGFPPPRKS